MAASWVLADFFYFLILLSLLQCPSEAAATSAAAPTSPPTTPLDDVPRRRIVGGTVIPMGQHPWMANRGLQCGGALIAPSWVITGGHCTSYEVGTDVNINHWNVDQYEPNAEVFQVVEVVRYPGFQNMGDYDDNDIALVRLSGVAVTKPIRMLTAAESPILEATGNMLWVAGWGSTSEDGEPQPFPSQVSIPVVAPSVCADPTHYGATEVAIIPSMLCAGYDAGGKDGCVGDSGGPLFARVSSGTTVEDVLVGVVSFGIGCGRPNRPGIYTRLSSFRDWVNSVISKPPPPPTCANMCGEYGNQACHCDDGCTQRQDCCADLTASCAAQSLATQTAYCGSAGACGRAVAGGSSGKIICYCHSACAQTVEGCCGDFMRACPVQYGQSLVPSTPSTTPMPSPATTPKPQTKTFVVPVPSPSLVLFPPTPRVVATTKLPARTTKPPTKAPVKKAATTKPPTLPPPTARRLTAAPTRAAVISATRSVTLATVGPRPMTITATATPGVIPPLQYSVPVYTSAGGVSPFYTSAGAVSPSYTGGGASPSSYYPGAGAGAPIPSYSASSGVSVPSYSSGIGSSSGVSVSSASSLTARASPVSPASPPAPAPAPSPPSAVLQTRAAPFIPPVPVPAASPSGAVAGAGVSSTSGYNSNLSPEIQANLQQQQQIIQQLTALRASIISSEDAMGTGPQTQTQTQPATSTTTTYPNYYQSGYPSQSQSQSQSLPPQQFQPQQFQPQQPSSSSSSSASTGPRTVTSPTSTGTNPGPSTSVAGPKPHS